MRLVLETSKTAFTVTKAAEPKTEFGGTQQKVDRATKCPVSEKLSQSQRV
jgi:hypothetical protein